MVCREPLVPSSNGSCPLAQRGYARLRKVFTSMPVGGCPDRRSFGGSSPSTLLGLGAVNGSVCVRPVQKTAQGNRAAGKLAVNGSSGLGICNQG